MKSAVPVSLVVVNYDRANALALLLKSLEFQRYPYFEIIIVSNLKPRERPETPLPVRWISFTERNISAARNLGIAEAGGDIIAFCDDDAVPEYGWLDTLIPAFDNAKVGSAGGFVRGRNGVAFQWMCAMVDRFGRDRRIDLPSSEMRIFPPEPDASLKTVGTNCAFRRDALLAVGGFDEAFYFYLDEADVNIRLGEAGWHSAIVPCAEVHHGYAEGPYRNRHRVPKTLREVGASEAYFLRKHQPDADGSSHLEGIANHQKKRLRWFFEQGLLTEARLAELLQSLQDGFAAGQAREPQYLRTGSNGAEFRPVERAENEAAPLLLVAKPYQPRRSLRQAAREAADKGVEVTLIEPEISHRNLLVRYKPEGYWMHRFGVAGFAERNAPRPFLPTRERVKAEINRVALQRRLICAEV